MCSFSTYKDWEAKGNTEGELRNILASEGSSTSQWKFNLRNMYFCHLFRDDEGNLMAYKVDPCKDTLDAVDRHPVHINMPGGYSYPESFIDELVEDALVLIPKSDEDSDIHPLFVSGLAIPTLCQQIDLSGCVKALPSLARAIFFAHQCYEKAPKSSLAVVKNWQGVNKTFAFLSTGYRHVDVKIVYELGDLLESKSGLGVKECIDWSVNHQLVRVLYAFPEHGKEVCEKYKEIEAMTPCVLIETSDVGECSIRVVAYWRTAANDLVYVGEVSRTHRGSFTKEDVYDSVRENIFDKYEELPRRLSELAYVPVTPRELDLTTSAGQEANSQLLSTVYSMTAEMLGIEKIVGQKRMEDFNDLVEFALLDGKRRYSANAVAMDMLAIPGMLRSWMKEASYLKADAHEKLMKAMAKAAYLDYEDIVRRALRKVPPMYFTPEED